MCNEALNINYLHWYSVEHFITKSYWTLSHLHNTRTQLSALLTFFSLDKPEFERRLWNICWVDGVVDVAVVILNFVLAEYLETRIIKALIRIVKAVCWPLRGECAVRGRRIVFRDTFCARSWRAATRTGGFCAGAPDNPRERQGPCFSSTSRAETPRVWGSTRGCCSIRSAGKSRASNHKSWINETFKYFSNKKSHPLWHLVAADDGVRGQAAPVSNDDWVHSAQKYIRQYENWAIDVKKQTSVFLWRRLSRRVIGWGCFLRSPRWGREARPSALRIISPASQDFSRACSMWKPAKQRSASEIYLLPHIGGTGYIMRWDFIQMNCYYAKFKTEKYSARLILDNFKAYTYSHFLSKSYEINHNIKECHLNV